MVPKSGEPQSACGHAVPVRSGRGAEASRMSKYDICVDFDGVIHSYTSGWQGSASVIVDPPTPGAFEFLAEAVEHFTVNIYSSRSKDPAGVNAMILWFKDQGLPPEVFEQLKFPTQKPAAVMTIDDRAFCFKGDFPSMEWLKNFKPWYK